MCVFLATPFLKMCDLATPFLKVFLKGIFGDTFSKGVCYIPNWLKLAKTGLGKYFAESLLYRGTLLQSNDGSGQRSHGGQGGTGAGRQLFGDEPAVPPATGQEEAVEDNAF